MWMYDVKIIVIKNGYALILNISENEYEIVKDFEVINYREYKGGIINYYPNNIYGLFGAVDNFRHAIEKDYITHDRLEELATLFKDGLIEDNKESAIEYFNEVCEMTDEEKEYFGIKEADEDE